MWNLRGRIIPSQRGPWSWCCSAAALEVAAASWALPRWVVVMVGIEPVSKSVPINCEQYEDRDIQDFPHPVAVGREAQNKLSL